MECVSKDAAEAVRLAVRVHGTKRGYHLAAEALNITERTARGLIYAETSGATIQAATAFRARVRFMRERAMQITAELDHMENAHNAASQAVTGAGIGLAGDADAFGGRGVAGA